MNTVDGGNFVPMTLEGDPEKHRYLHNWKTWTGKTRVGGRGAPFDNRSCPGCVFPDAPAGKWPHVQDSRCEVWRTRQKAEVVA